MSTIVVTTLSEIRARGLSEKDREMIRNAPCNPDDDCPALTKEQLKKLRRPAEYYEKSKSN